MQLRKNPLGEYVGKIGNTVGGKYKGIYWVRALVYPTQRGTLDLYKLLKQGMITPDRFSYKQFNIRRTTLGPLGWVAEKNMEELIYPIWEPLCKKRFHRMSGGNLFVKKNANVFFNSMPNKHLEFNPTTNAPDLMSLKMSDGDLEPTSGVIGATYATGTGIVHADWNFTTFKNGQGTDKAYMVVLMKPIINPPYTESGEWTPGLYMYGTGATAIAGKTRANGAAEITIPTGLTATDLCLYVFFKDAAGEIGFSRSVARNVLAA
jgi:hypothetical protein